MKIRHFCKAQSVIISLPLPPLYCSSNKLVHISDKKALSRQKQKQKEKQ